MWWQVNRRLIFRIEKRFRIIGFKYLPVYFKQHGVKKYQLKHSYDVTPLSFQYIHMNIVLWSAATIHAVICLSPLTRK